jgi:hypothetical protein
VYRRRSGYGLECYGVSLNIFIAKEFVELLISNLNSKSALTLFSKALIPQFYG